MEGLPPLYTLYTFKSRRTAFLSECARLLKARSSGDLCKSNLIVSPRTRARYKSRLSLSLSLVVNKIIRPFFSAQFAGYFEVARAVYSIIYRR